MKKKLIVANWKMNNSFDEAEAWLQSFNKKLTHFKTQKQKNLPEVVLCPPFIVLDYLDELLMENELKQLKNIYQNINKIPEEQLESLSFKVRDINLGGQDCHFEENGPYTGDTSAKMLKDCGCQYVLVGHSERRQYHFETGEIIAKKTAAAVKHNLIPILCIGEPKELKERGQHLAYLREQILTTLEHNSGVKEIVVAYEPVWSIGTGILPSYEQIAIAIELINNYLSREVSNYRILYGGSVKKENAADLLKVPLVDGLLVGGMSLEAHDFFDIIKIAAS